MPVPVVDNAHVAEGVGLLTSRYKNAAVVKGITTALMLRFQEAEAQLWSLINGVQLSNHPMAGGPWSILDQLASLVGVPGGRKGLSDADLVTAIRLQIKVNRSHGLAEDVIQVLKLATGNSQLYLDAPPAGFIVSVLDISDAFAAILASIVTQVRSAGTSGTLIYTTWSPGNDLILDSTTGHIPAASHLGSTTDGTGGLLATVLPV
jgi:hypothetical protein